MLYKAVLGIPAWTEHPVESDLADVESPSTASTAKHGGLTLYVLLESKYEEEI